MSDRSPPAQRPLPSVRRVAWLIVAFALRRSLNRLQALRKKGNKPELGRTATARKGAAGGYLVYVFSALFLFSGVSQAARLVHGVAALAQRSDGDDIALVRRSTLEWLDWADEQTHSARPNAGFRSKLRDAFERLADREGPSDDVEKARRTSLRMRLFDEHGRAAFHESPLHDNGVFPSRSAWYGPHGGNQMLVPLGLVSLLLSVSITLIAVAGVNQDLAKVEWTLEWWFTFPVPARGLLLARVLETAFASPFAWFVLGPFFSVTFWCAGYAWFGVLLGFFCVVYVGLLAGCLRVVTETALRRWVSLRNVARVQAVLSVVSVLPLVAALAAASPEPLQKLAQFARQLPPYLLVNPLSPVTIAAGGGRAVETMLACAAFACAVTAVSTAFAAWVVRDGLTTSAGPHQGKRGASARRVGRPQRAGLLGALARKELWLLFRDRTLLLQTFVLPAVVFGMQFLMNRSFARTFNSTAQHAAGMAFGLSAFVLSTGACNTLAVEVPVLWLYFTIPKALDRLFLEKAVFWAGLSSAIAVVTYGTAAFTAAWSPLAGGAMFALVLVGVVLNAFIATGIGVLGTRALESEARRRIPPSMSYLYMVLASTFAYALYAPSAWAKCAQVVLSTLLAYALWQKVHDHAPFLLDPEAKPAPSIAVADGVIAALAFFILQGLFTLLFLSEDYSPGASILLAFSLAGLLASSAALFSFWRLGVPNLFAAVGLRAPRHGLARGVLTGIAAGLGCGLVGKGYLTVVEHIEALRSLRDETMSVSNGGSNVAVWFAILAIFATPVFEEFLFRGVLYGGFRRSLGALGAALASAAVFAIVHPAIASAPVFVLGFTAALVYERERSLLPPMATHMTYNALVLGMAFLRR